MEYEGVNLGEDREELNSQEMLFQGFFDNYNNPELAEMVKEDLEESSDGSISVNEKKKSTKKIIELQKIREELIDAFKTVDYNSQASEKLANTINRLGIFIRSAGGMADEFNAITHVSGLSPSNSFLQKNAQRVVETTKDCYQLGSVANSSVDDNNKIVIAFAGEQMGVHYKAIGEISSHKGWTGSEAIDYVYTPGCGRMSVKAFEHGNWNDRSDDYDISWNILEAVSKEALDELEDKLNPPEQKETPEVSENKEEEISSDFPIEGK